MSTGLAAFDTTINTTNQWLRDIMDRMGWQDRHLAYQALRVVLHTMRDRLSVDEVANLGAQLPMLVRGFYYEGWQPTGKPARERTKQAFLAHIGAAFPDDTTIALEHMTRIVLEVLGKHMTEGELRHILHALPAELRNSATQTFDNIVR